MMDQKMKTEMGVNGVVAFDKPENSKDIELCITKGQSVTSDLIDLDKMIKERRKARIRRILIEVSRFAIAYFVPFIVLLVCLLLPPIMVNRIEFFAASHLTTYPGVYLLFGMIFVIEVLIVYGWTILYRLYLHILRLNKIIK